MSACEVRDGDGGANLFDRILRLLDILSAIIRSVELLRVARLEDPGFEASCSGGNFAAFLLRDALCIGFADVLKSEQWRVASACDGGLCRLSCAL